MFSRLAANDQLQTRRCAGSALRASRPVAALCAQVRVHDDPEFSISIIFMKGVSAIVPPVCLTGVPTKLLKTGRGFGLGALSHSHRSRFNPLGVTGRRVFREVCLLPASWGTRHIYRSAGSSRARDHLAQPADSSPSARANTLGHQHCVHALADRLHLSSLSKFNSSRWVQPIEKGFADAQIFFAPGANAYD